MVSQWDVHVILNATVLSFCPNNSHGDKVQGDNLVRKLRGRIIMLTLRRE